MRYHIEMISDWGGLWPHAIADSIGGNVIAAPPKEAANFAEIDFPSERKADVDRILSADENVIGWRQEHTSPDL